MTENNSLDPQTPPTPPSPPPVPPPLNDQQGTAAPGTTYTGPEPTPEARNLAMLCHLLSIFTGFLACLIIWLLKKDSHPFIDDQGKEALNFQITMLIGFLVAGVTMCIVVGFFLAPVLVVLNLVFCIMGTVKAHNGIAYRYPFNLRFIK